MQVKHLKDAELQGEERAKPKRPRTLVLGPTRELTDQILGVAKSMSHFAKFRSACVNGGAAVRLTASGLLQAKKEKPPVCCLLYLCLVQDFRICNPHC